MFAEDHVMMDEEEFFIFQSLMKELEQLRLEEVFQQCSLHPLLIPHKHTAQLKRLVLTHIVCRPLVIIKRRFRIGLTPIHGGPVLVHPGETVASLYPGPHTTFWVGLRIHHTAVLTGRRGFVDLGKRV